MAQTGQNRTFRSELAHGLTLVKEETDHLKNYQHLDQVNSYTVSTNDWSLWAKLIVLISDQVESELDVPANITVDIAGSTGVQFSGPFDSKVMQQTQKVEANGSAKICDLKLFGDWKLSIHFTYDINDVSEERAREIKLEPSRDKARRKEEEVK